MSSVPGDLSVRSTQVDVIVPPYFSLFFQFLQDIWSPENPNGKVLLAIAENKLQLPRLVARLDSAPAPTPVDYGYGERAGLLELRKAVAGILTTYFLNDGEDAVAEAAAEVAAPPPSSDSSVLPRSSVHASELIVHNGVTSCIEATFWALAEDGDAVLIPTPYYPAFERDVAGRFGARLVGIPAIDEARDVEAQLDAALADATRALAVHAEDARAPAGRRPPRVSSLLIANPGNPTGHVYSQETVAALVRWAVRNRVHLVSDEIYGLSVHDAADPVFRSSAVRVARDLVAGGEVTEVDAARYVHVFWGLSKDFGVSGARVGFVWTRSQDLYRALLSSSLFYGVGGAAQRRYADLLADRAFVRSFVADNRRLLRKSYDDAVAKLHSVGVETSGARGAMFIWADLGPWVRARTQAQGAAAKPSALPALTQAQRDAVDKVFQLGRSTEVVDAEADQEIAFWTDLTLATGVLLTPGASCRSPTPGFVRFCFAWVPYEALMLAVDRIVAYLKENPRA